MIYPNQGGGPIPPHVQNWLDDYITGGQTPAPFSPDLLPFS